MEIEDIDRRLVEGVQAPPGRAGSSAAPCRSPSFDRRRHRSRSAGRVCSAGQATATRVAVPPTDGGSPIVFARISTVAIPRSRMARSVAAWPLSIGRRRNPGTRVFAMAPAGKRVWRTSARHSTVLQPCPISSATLHPTGGGRSPPPGITTCAPRGCRSRTFARWRCPPTTSAPSSWTTCRGNLRWPPASTFATLAAMCFTGALRKITSATPTPCRRSASWRSLSWRRRRTQGSRLRRGGTASRRGVARARAPFHATPGCRSPAAPD